MFSCEICNYDANTKAVLARHLTSKKHIKLAEATTTTSTSTSTIKEPEPPTNELQCNNCNKEFKSKVGLERHMKKCKKIENTVAVTENDDESSNNEDQDMNTVKKEYEHNITRLIVEIIRNRYEFEIETEMLKKSYEEKISEMKNEFDRAFISKELEIKKLQVQIQALSKKK